jgi:anti-sigma factor RsiW
VPKGPDQQRLTPEERANLVAYLDEELNEAEARAIATKLTQSVTARRELEVLQKTWELLGHLPMPRASESLTQRTLTEVDRIDVAGDKLRSSASKSVQRAAVLLLAVLASAACFVLALVLVRWVLPDPTARLAHDLTIAEHLDEYQDVGTIEFLERLDKSPEFANDQN